MYEARNAQQAGRGNRNEAARPGPYCVDEIELGRTVHGAYGTNCSCAREAETDVMDMRPGQLPIARLSVLTQGEDLHVMTTRQAADQRHQGGDYPILSRPIDTSRYHQSDSHVAGQFPRLPMAECATYDMRSAR
jgi:hypothetical protein